MKSGTLYGIGIGPGDPDLITVKGAKILAACRHVFVPKASEKVDSLALSIAEKHIDPEAEIHEIIFPMTSDQAELNVRWEQAAKQVVDVLETGMDACFVTLGDTFLYSTYIYMLRALRRRIPDVEVVTIPGITSFSAAAALAEFPIGEAKDQVTIVPTSSDLEEVRRAVNEGGTVILMKIGKRLGRILDILESTGALGRSVFVSHVGFENQRIETDLNKLRGDELDVGYLSIILIRAKGEEA